ncbi:MAG: methyltransferase domain-containing protein [Alphaproteobacteria bacterium]|nr:methyltransferase domain-containing protein [Alphaproteobacteria bacterium]
MRRNVTDFHEFYTGALGGMVQHALVRKLGDFLKPDKQTCLAFGYVFPFVKETNDFFAVLMPGYLGAKSWPEGRLNRVAVIDEYPWPIETNSVDQLLIVHGLEYTQNPDAVLKEAWRVLKSQGRLKLVVPNRFGFWARSDRNVLGFGRPYSAGQLLEILRACNFVKEKQERALFTPPLSWRWVVRLSPYIEKYMGWLLDSFGGVHIVEVSKQLYAGLPVTVAETTKEKPVLAVKPTA